MELINGSGDDTPTDALARHLRRLHLQYGEQIPSEVRVAMLAAAVQLDRYVEFFRPTGPAAATYDVTGFNDHTAAETVRLPICRDDGDGEVIAGLTYVPLTGDDVRAAAGDPFAAWLRSYEPDGLQWLIERLNTIDVRVLQLEANEVNRE